MKRFTIYILFAVILSLSKNGACQSPDNPKVKRIDWKETSAPSTITNQARMFFDAATDSFKARMPNGTIFTFGGGIGSPIWTRTADSVYLQNNAWNVGIGTNNPEAKLEVLGVTVITDSTGSGVNDYWRYIMGNYLGTNTFSATNLNTGSGIYLSDSMGNAKSKVYGFINGLNYDSRDSTDIFLEIGQRLQSSEHSAQIEMHTNAATNEGHVHIDVMDTAANEIQFHIETTGDSLVELSTNALGFKINADTILVPQFAGSAQKLVTADATGVLDTVRSTGGDSLWTLLSTNVLTDNRAQPSTGADASTNIGFNAICTGTSSTAVGYGVSVTAQDAQAFGTNSNVSAQYGTSIGFQATTSGISSTAIGYGAYARVPGTTNISGIIAIRKADADAGSASTQYMSGCEVVVLSRLDTLTATGSLLISIPTNSKFFVDEVGFIVTSANTVTVQPTISYGKTGSSAFLLAATATTGLTAAGNRDRQQSLLSNSGVTSLTATVTVAATATTLIGRYYFKGFIVEDQ